MCLELEILSLCLKRVDKFELTSTSRSLFASVGVVDPDWDGA